MIIDSNFNKEGEQKWVVCQKCGKPFLLQPNRCFRGECKNGEIVYEILCESCALKKSSINGSITRF